MASAGLLFTHNTFLSSCVGSADDHSSADISAISPSSGLNAGIAGYTYSSNLTAQDPAGLTSDQVVVRQHDSYVEHVTFTCDLPASYNTELLDMAFEVNSYSGSNAHFDAPNAQVFYIVSPENSLEFFPLDRSNYIEHAEITEDGQGVLIEYAQAVTDNTGTYRLTALDGSAIALTIAEANVVWLNDKTVWLTLASDIYKSEGVNTGSGVVLDADRHVLVTSTFPDDTSFGTNFSNASTYRAVLTRHASDADLDQTAAGAPRITGIEVADGTESIDLTFSRAVCGSPETGCDPLTADHFEVLHYEGDISETGAPTQLTIDSVNLTGDATDGYTAVALNINLPPLLNIDSNDYVLVRTARNSRFSDQFITDRTVFSATKISRDIPANIPVETYTEAESGMLHLQGGALARAIPTIVYSLTNPDGSSGNYSVDEGDTAEHTTSTFTITRSPTGYDMPSATSVTVTNTAGGNPAGFGLSVDGIKHPRVDDFIAFERMITFAAGEDSETIDIQHEGNDAPNDDYVYTINIEPVSIPGGSSQQITFTIEDDDRGIDLLAIDDSTILETAVENEVGSEQQFVRIYPAGTTAIDIITEVGVDPGTFSITQIMLSITGSNIDADSTIVVTHANNPFATPSSAGNGEFTFDGGAGVAIDVAETFLESLEFGIDSPEPTGPVTLELTITDSEGTEETETVTRTINEINDPVELVGLTEGTQFTVLADDLFDDTGSGSLLVITAADNINVNNGGDDSGISVEIVPPTLSVPTMADHSVMGTLTLSGNVTTAGEFTLSISQSSTELAGRDDPLDVTLTFSDGRGSIETRRITINIINGGLTLFDAEPADFDRLLVGEMILRGNPPTDSDCKTGTVDTCSGVLYLRLSPTLNSAAGGNELVVKMEARAGQEAIGTLLVPAVPARCEGGLFPIDIEGVCVNFAGGTFIPGEAEIPGTIDADNPANLLYNVQAQFTYSKEIFPGNPDTFTTVCTGVTAHATTQVSSNEPTPARSSIENGVITYSYESANQATAPGRLTPDQIIQYPADDYAELMTLTCNLPATASTQLLGMSYHLSAYGNLAHHVGADLGNSYVTSPENSLEFFPLDGSNYIKHAEITEDGLGVLIEYAQAVTENTGQTYSIATTSLDVITPTISDIIWLNDKTVWLTLGSDIYTGVNVATAALDADRHVLVTSTFPDDTSFEVGGTANFGSASTYRAVLTRHASDMDLARTAPRITEITVAPGTESIDLTFSSPVCGSPETGCAALTADHFEVMHYEGDISSAESATLLTISTAVNLTGDSTNGYTVAVLDIDLDSAPEIDGNDYLLVRTARNSRFTDNFITDRTIFSAAKATRTIPATNPAETYNEAESGMLHLQSGALKQAIPVITYTLAPAPGIPPSPDIETDSPSVYSIREGGVTDDTASTFTIMRSPTGYNVETNSLVTITNIAGGNPDGFGLGVGGVHLTGNFTSIPQPITFAAGENEQTISFQFTGNDTLNDDHKYTIRIAPANVPPGDDEEIITFTITDDEGIDLLAIDGSAILETAVEKEGVQQYIGVYSDATPSANIITEVGVTSGTFTITQIVLSIIGIGADSTVVGTHDNSFDEDNNGNEFTFDSRDSDGVAISDAETFLQSLEFGINSDEPTGFLTGATTPTFSVEVTVMLTITAITAASEEAEDTETTTRTIIEENDPVEVVGLAEGEQFTVSARDLEGSGSVPIIGS